MAFLAFLVGFSLLVSGEFRDKQEYFILTPQDQCLDIL